MSDKKHVKITFNIFLILLLVTFVFAGLLHGANVWNRISIEKAVSEMDESINELFKEKDLMTFEEFDKKLKIIQENFSKSLSKVISNYAFFTLFLLVILIIALTKFLSGYLHKKLINPLRKLVDAAHKIGKGELDTKIDINSKDEIGDLANAFSEMVYDLKEYEKRVKKHEKELEINVEKRTNELQDKLDELERFNKLSIGRELKMVALKKENNELREKLKKI